MKSFASLEKTMANLTLSLLSTEPSSRSQCQLLQNTTATAEHRVETCWESAEANDDSSSAGAFLKYVKTDELIVFKSMATILCDGNLPAETSAECDLMAIELELSQFFDMSAQYGKGQELCSALWMSAERLSALLMTCGPDTMSVLSTLKAQVSRLSSMACSPMDCNVDFAMTCLGAARRSLGTIHHQELASQQVCRDLKLSLACATNHTVVCRGATYNVLFEHVDYVRARYRQHCIVTMEAEPSNGEIKGEDAQWILQTAAQAELFSKPVICSFAQRKEWFGEDPKSSPLLLESPILSDLCLDKPEEPVCQCDSNAAGLVDTIVGSLMSASLNPNTSFCNSTEESILTLFGQMSGCDYGIKVAQLKRLNSMFSSVCNKPLDTSRMVCPTQCKPDACEELICGDISECLTQNTAGCDAMTVLEIALYSQAKREECTLDADAADVQLTHRPDLNNVLLCMKGVAIDLRLKKSTMPLGEYCNTVDTLRHCLEGLEEEEEDADSQLGFKAAGYSGAIYKMTDTSVCDFMPETACGSGSKADVVFVLDGSSSVGIDNMKLLLTFIKDTLSVWDIDQDAIRVGVVIFSQDAVAEFQLNHYDDKDDLVDAIDAIHYSGGSTNTADALKLMTDVMFLEENGNRKGVPNFGIIITDGKSNDGNATLAAADAAKEKGIKILSVGIGGGVDMDELKAMASPPHAKNVFTVANFSQLAAVQSDFLQQTCSVISDFLLPFTVSEDEQCSQAKELIQTVELSFLQVARVPYYSLTARKHVCENLPKNTWDLSSCGDGEQEYVEELFGKLVGSIQQLCGLSEPEEGCNLHAASSCLQELVNAFVLPAVSPCSLYSRVEVCVKRHTVRCPEAVAWPLTGSLGHWKELAQSTCYKGPCDPPQAVLCFMDIHHMSKSPSPDWEGICSSLATSIECAERNVIGCDRCQQDTVKTIGGKISMELAETCIDPPEVKCRALAAMECKETLIKFTTDFDGQADGLFCLKVFEARKCVAELTVECDSATKLSVGVELEEIITTHGGESCSKDNILPVCYQTLVDRVETILSFDPFDQSDPAYKYKPESQDSDDKDGGSKTSKGSKKDSKKSEDKDSKKDSKKSKDKDSKKDSKKSKDKDSKKDSKKSKDKDSKKDSKKSEDKDKSKGSKTESKDKDSKTSKDSNDSEKGKKSNASSKSSKNSGGSSKNRKDSKKSGGKSSKDSKESMSLEDIEEIEFPTTYLGKICREAQMAYLCVFGSLEDSPPSSMNGLTDVLATTWKLAWLRCEGVVEPLTCYTCDNATDNEVCNTNTPQECENGYRMCQTKVTTDKDSRIVNIWKGCVVPYECKPGCEDHKCTYCCDGEEGCNEPDDGPLTGACDLLEVTGCLSQLTSAILETDTVNCSFVQKQSACVEYARKECEENGRTQVVETLSGFLGSETVAQCRVELTDGQCGLYAVSAVASLIISGLHPENFDFCPLLVSVESAIAAARSDEDCEEEEVNAVAASFDLLRSQLWYLDCTSTSEPQDVCDPLAAFQQCMPTSTSDCDLASKESCMSGFLAGCQPVQQMFPYLVLRISSDLLCNNDSLVLTLPNLVDNLKPLSVCLQTFSFSFNAALLDPFQLWAPVNQLVSCLLTTWEVQLLLIQPPVYKVYITEIIFFLQEVLLPAVTPDAGEVAINNASTECTAGLVKASAGFSQEVMLMLLRPFGSFSQSYDFCAICTSLEVEISGHLSVCTAEEKKYQLRLWGRLQAHRLTLCPDHKPEAQCSLEVASQCLARFTAFMDIIVDQDGLDVCGALNSSLACVKAYTSTCSAGEALVVNQAVLEVVSVCQAACPQVVSEVVCDVENVVDVSPACSGDSASLLAVCNSMQVSMSCLSVKEVVDCYKAAVGMCPNNADENRGDFKSNFTVQYRFASAFCGLDLITWNMTAGDQCGAPICDLDAAAQCLVLNDLTSADTAATQAASRVASAVKCFQDNLAGCDVAVRAYVIYKAHIQLTVFIGFFPTLVDLNLSLDVQFLDPFGDLVPGLVQFAVLLDQAIYSPQWDLLPLCWWLHDFDLFLTKSIDSTFRTDLLKRGSYGIRASLDGVCNDPNVIGVILDILPIDEEDGACPAKEFMENASRAFYEAVVTGIIQGESRTHLCTVLEMVGHLDLSTCSAGRQRQLKLLINFFQQVAGQVCSSASYCSVTQVQQCTMEVVTVLGGLGVKASTDQVCISVSTLDACLTQFSYKCDDSSLMRIKTSSHFVRQMAVAVCGEIEPEAPPATCAKPGEDACSMDTVRECSFNELFDLLSTFSNKDAHCRILQHTQDCYDRVNKSCAKENTAFEAMYGLPMADLAALTEEWGCNAEEEDADPAACTQGCNATAALECITTLSQSLSFIDPFGDACTLVTQARQCLLEKVSECEESERDDWHSRLTSVLTSYHSLTLHCVDVYTCLDSFFAISRQILSTDGKPDPDDDKSSSDGSSKKESEDKDSGKGSKDKDSGKGSKDKDSGKGSKGSGKGSKGSGKGSKGSGKGSKDSGKGSKGSGKGSKDSSKGSKGSGKGSKDKDSGKGSKGSGKGSKDKGSGKGSKGSGKGSKEQGGTGSDSSLLYLCQHARQSWECAERGLKALPKSQRDLLQQIFLPLWAVISEECANTVALECYTCSNVSYFNSLTDDVCEEETELCGRNQRCSSQYISVNNKVFVTRGCLHFAHCHAKDKKDVDIKCCDQDLCNTNADISTEPDTESTCYLEHAVDCAFTFAESLLTRGSVDCIHSLKKLQCVSEYSTHCPGAQNLHSAANLLMLTLAQTTCVQGELSQGCSSIAVSSMEAILSNAFSSDFACSGLNASIASLDFQEQSGECTALDLVALREVLSYTSVIAFDACNADNCESPSTPTKPEKPQEEKKDKEDCDYMDTSLCGRNALSVLNTWTQQNKNSTCSAVKEDATCAVTNLEGCQVPPCIQGLIDQVKNKAEVNCDMDFSTPDDTDHSQDGDQEECKPSVVCDIESAFKCADVLAASLNDSDICMKLEKAGECQASNTSSCRSLLSVLTVSYFKNTVGHVITTCQDSVSVDLTPPTDVYSQGATCVLDLHSQIEAAMSSINFVEPMCTAMASFQTCQRALPKLIEEFLMNDTMDLLGLISAQGICDSGMQNQTDDRDKREANCSLKDRASATLQVTFSSMFNSFPLSSRPGQCMRLKLALEVLAEHLGDDCKYLGLSTNEQRVLETLFRFGSEQQDKFCVQLDYEPAGCKPDLFPLCMESFSMMASFSLTEPGTLCRAAESGLECLKKFSVGCPGEGDASLHAVWRQVKATVGNTCPNLTLGLFCPNAYPALTNVYSCNPVKAQTCLPTKTYLESVTDKLKPDYCSDLTSNLTCAKNGVEGCLQSEIQDVQATVNSLGEKLTGEITSCSSGDSTISASLIDYSSACVAWQPCSLKAALACFQQKEGEDLTVCQVLGQKRSCLDMALGSCNEMMEVEAIAHGLFSLGFEAMDPNCTAPFEGLVSAFSQNENDNCTKNFVEKFMSAVKIDRIVSDVCSAFEDYKSCVTVGKLDFLDEMTDLFCQPESDKVNASTAEVSSSCDIEAASFCLVQELMWVFNRRLLPNADNRHFCQQWHSQETRKCVTKATSECSSLVKSLYSVVVDMSNRLVLSSGVCDTLRVCYMEEAYYRINQFSVAISIYTVDKDTTKLCLQKQETETNVARFTSTCSGAQKIRAAASLTRITQLVENICVDVELPSPPICPELPVEQRHCNIGAAFTCVIQFSTELIAQGLPLFYRDWCTSLENTMQCAAFNTSSCDREDDVLQTVISALENFREVAGLHCHWLSTDMCSHSTRCPAQDASCDVKLQINLLRNPLSDVCLFMNEADVCVEQNTVTCTPAQKLVAQGTIQRRLQQLLVPNLKCDGSELAPCLLRAKAASRQVLTSLVGDSNSTACRTMTYAEQCLTQRVNALVPGPTQQEQTAQNMSVALKSVIGGWCTTPGTVACGTALAQLMNTLYNLTVSLTTDQELDKAVICSTRQAVLADIAGIHKLHGSSCDFSALDKVELELGTGIFSQCIADPQADCGSAVAAAQTCFSNHNSSSDFCSGLNSVLVCMAPAVGLCSEDKSQTLVEQFNTLLGQSGSCDRPPLIALSTPTSSPLYLSEQGGFVDITFSIHEAYAVYAASDAKREVYIRAQVSNNDPPTCLEEGSAEISQVSVLFDGGHPCGVRLGSGDAWNSTHTIRLVANLDGREDNMQQATVSLYAEIFDYDEASSSWVKSQEPFPIAAYQVNIEDTDVNAVCSSVGAHTETFDGTVFNNFEDGEFVLYRNTFLDVEVTVSYQQCTPAATCTCAIKVTTENTAVMFDRCQHIGASGSPPDMAVSFIGDWQQAQGMAVYRHSDLQSYYVVLPSGTIVTVKASVLFLDVWVSASAFDYGKTEGLCGLFDLNAYNDLMLPGGESYSMAVGEMQYNILSPKGFINAWQTSQANRSRGASAASSCSCLDSNPMAGQCSAVSRVATCDFIQGEDITQLVAGVAAQTPQSDAKRRRRRAADTPTNSTQTNGWPTASNWTEEKAMEHCEILLERTVALKYCAQAVNLANGAYPFEHLITTCVDTIRLFDSTVHDNLTVIQAVETCRSMFLHDATYQVNDTVRHAVLLFFSHTCDGNCNGNGDCRMGVCHCYPGFVGGNCSYQRTDLPRPHDTDIIKNGLCEVSDTSRCDDIFITGKGFVESHYLACHIQAVKVMSSGFNSPVGLMTKVPAKLVTATMAHCQITRSDRAQQTLMVAVSNDGINPTASMLYSAYDPQCYTCHPHTHQCTHITTTTCEIEGQCYMPEESAAADKCLFCDPLKTAAKWSVRDLPECEDRHDETDEDDDDDTKLSPLLIAILAVGAALLVVGIIGITICCVTRRKPSRSNRDQEFGRAPPSYDNPGYNVSDMEPQQFFNQGSIHKRAVTHVSTRIPSTVQPDQE